MHVMCTALPNGVKPIKTPVAVQSQISLYKETYYLTQE